MLIDKITDSKELPTESNLSTQVFGGKGRKTKRSKYMGGNTKKRTKGRKRRTSKK